MKILVKDTLILDKNSSYHKERLDVFIEEGIIQKIGKNLSLKSDQIISEKGLCTSIGWFDFFVDFANPGREDRETLEKAILSSRIGGFTGVGVSPQTFPVLDNKYVIEYLKNKSSKIDIYPYGSISKNLEQKEISEYYDIISETKSKVFSSGDKYTPTFLQKIALQYAKNSNGLIISFPHNFDFFPEGVMNEGLTSTRMGVKPIPPVFENIIVNRDLELSKYLECPIFIRGVSTKESLELVRKSKQEKRGFPIYCGISAHQLSFLEEDLFSFDTRLKILPPFRKEEDKIALKEAVLDNTIDVIYSDFSPSTVEEKETDFSSARFGIVNNQSFLSSLQDSFPELDLESFIEKVAYNPRHILERELPKIKEGEEANLTFFSKEKTSLWTSKKLISKSKNSPFLGKKMKGKVLGSIYKGDLFLEK